MTIIQAIKDFIATCPHLVEGGLFVEYLGNNPTGYAVIALPGQKVIEEDVIGNKLCQFLFAFQSMEYTLDELQRLETHGFYEAFSSWLDSQDEAGTYPTLDNPLKPTKIEALEFGFLYEQGQSDTAVYRIACRLEYEQPR